MKNQWGQEIEVGDIIVHQNKTGAVNERFLGKVTGFSKRATWNGEQTTVHVTYLFDGTWQGTAEEHEVKTAVGLRTVVKVDPAGLYPYIRERLSEAK